MANDAAAWEHRLLTHLTAIQLANQILDRQAGLSVYQRRLVRTAIDATDLLTAALLSKREPTSERGTTRMRLVPGRQDDCAERLGCDGPPGHDTRVGGRSS